MRCIHSDAVRRDVDRFKYQFPRVLRGFPGTGYLTAERALCGFRSQREAVAICEQASTGHMIRCHLRVTPYAMTANGCRAICGDRQLGRVDRSLSSSGASPELKLRRAILPIACALTRDCRIISE